MDGRRQDGVVINLAAETGHVVAPLLCPACGDALAPQAPPAHQEGQQPAPAGGAAPAVEEGQQPDPAGGMTAGDAAAISAELFRGLAWLMMLLLATLFMGMAFLAITNPPNWMPPDFGFTKAGKAASAAPSPASADISTSRISFGYLVLNTATFAMAPTTVLMPLSTEAPPTNYLSGITHMMVLVYITFSCSFVVVISNDPRIFGVVVGILATFATVAYFGIRFLSKPAAN